MKMIWMRTVNQEKIWKFQSHETVLKLVFQKNMNKTP